MDIKPSRNEIGFIYIREALKADYVHLDHNQRQSNDRLVGYVCICVAMVTLSSIRCINTVLERIPRGDQYPNKKRFHLH